MPGEAIFSGHRDSGDRSWLNATFRAEPATISIEPAHVCRLKESEGQVQSIPEGVRGGGFRIISIATARRPIPIWSSGTLFKWRRAGRYKVSCSPTLVHFDHSFPRLPLPTAMPIASLHLARVRT